MQNRGRERREPQIDTDERADSPEGTRGLVEEFGQSALSDRAAEANSETREHSAEVTGMWSSDLVVE